MGNKIIPQTLSDQDLSNQIVSSGMSAVSLRFLAAQNGAFTKMISFPVAKLSLSMMNKCNDEYRTRHGSDHPLLKEFKEHARSGFFKMEHAKFDVFDGNLYLDVEAYVRSIQQQLHNKTLVDQDRSGIVEIIASTQRDLVKYVIGVEARKANAEQSHPLYEQVKAKDPKAAASIERRRTSGVKDDEAILLLCAGLQQQLSDLSFALTPIAIPAP